MDQYIEIPASPVQQDICAAIFHARAIDQRVAIFAARLSGKTTALISYITDSLINGNAENVVLFLANQYASSFALHAIKKSLSAKTKNAAVEIVNANEICAAIKQRKKCSVICLVNEIPDIYKAILENSETLILADEINAFNNTFLQYLLLRVPKFIAIGSKEENDCIITKILKTNTTNNIFSLRF